VCDTYAGPSSLRIGAVERSHWIEGGDRILYVWEQREFDPCTARAVNAMHFRVERDGEIVQSIEDAFVYRWRLWSVPELRDAMAEAGFAGTETASLLPAQDDSEGFIPCVVGRTSPAWRQDSSLAVAMPAIGADGVGVRPSDPERVHP